MRRCLLVLDRDLGRDPVTAGEQSSPEPVSYLAARQEQEPCEVVVLTLVRTRQAQVPPFVALYTADKIGRYPAKSLPGHDVAAAEHRMDSAVLQLEQAGCHAVGVITGQRQLDTAVRAEIRGHDYDEVILVTGRNSGTWLTRLLRLDPVHRLRLRLGHRLTVFPLGAAARQTAPVS
jgi:hypothetical protein